MRRMFFGSYSRASEKEMLERYRLDSEIALLEELNSPNRPKRVDYEEGTSIPYRWICLLRVPGTDPTRGAYGLGTGVLIGPRHVLTAAHVLANTNEPQETVGWSLRVEPARNGNAKPVDEVGIRGWQVHPQSVAKIGKRRVIDPRYDYGLVTLKKDVSKSRDSSWASCELAYWGARGTCGARSEIGVTASQITGQEAQLAGYPGYKQENGDRVPRPPNTLWKGSGRITVDRDASMILHTVETSGGQSGGPIWFMRNGVSCLAGIHSGPPIEVQDAQGRTLSTHKAAVLITPQIVKQLEAWKGTFAR